MLTDLRHRGAYVCYQSGAEHRDKVFGRIGLLLALSVVMSMLNLLLVWKFPKI